MDLTSRNDGPSRPWRERFSKCKSKWSAEIIQLNGDICRLSEQINQMKADRDLLLSKTQLFLSLLFDKIAGEATWERTPNRDLETQIIRVIVSRVRVVARYFDRQVFDFVNAPAAAVLSSKAVKSGEQQSFFSRRVQQVYFSRKRARKRIADLQLAHTKLRTSAHAVKQLLLRFDEDNALLKQDLALLQQNPPKLDSARATETWNKLARVELYFQSEAQKRRSLASQRRMSALSARRMSSTGSLSSQFMTPAQQESLAVARRNSRLDRSLSVLSDTIRQQGSQPSSGVPLRYSSTERAKRLSIVSMGKRSGAVLSDWHWESEDSREEELRSAAPNEPCSTDESTSVNQSTATEDTVTTEGTGVSEGGVESKPTITSEAEPSYTFSDASQLDIGKNCATARTSTRPRSFVVPMHRYSAYDQNGRKQAPTCLDSVLADNLADAGAARVRL